MARSLDDMNRALKLKASPRPGSLTLRVGTKKHVLPFEVRTIQGEGFLFVHLPPSAGILKLSDQGAELVTDEKTAEAAMKSFRKPRTQPKAKPATAEVPPELADALKKIPAGFKPVFDKDGVRLVSTRNRKK